MAQPCAMDQSTNAGTRWLSGRFIPSSNSGHRVSFGVLDIVETHVSKQCQPTGQYIRFQGSAKLHEHTGVTPVDGWVLVDLGVCERFMFNLLALIGVGTSLLRHSSSDSSQSSDCSAALC